MVALHTQPSTAHPPLLILPELLKEQIRATSKARLLFSAPIQKQENEGQEDLSRQIAFRCVASM